MDIFIIIFLILFSIGVLSIILTNKEHLRRFLRELEVVAVILLLVLIIYIQQYILSDEVVVRWSYERLESLQHQYIFSLSNVSFISVVNVTRFHNTIRIYADYYVCGNTTDVSVAIYLPNEYERYPKELVIKKKICNEEEGGK
ncbi:MAG: hypothetical protein NZ908_01745 [Candidatus Micrarchaeota archaeon]|nr:hypothetical protein [Candidatus Micrarchaeota archaeon]MCX8154432.1 hypothetical protein [Candidatus Micrarchaeota archaeon]